MLPKDETDIDQPAKAPEPKSKGFSELNMVHVATIVYAIMATVGLIVMIYIRADAGKAFSWPGTYELRMKLTAATFLGTGLLLIASHLCESWFNAFHSIKVTLANAIGQSSYATAVYLALISSVGEELLFRGAIQPYTGLVFASAIFGLAHLGPEGVSVWTIWAFFAGLLIGWIYQATGSILPAIAIHFLVNATSLLRLQYDARRGFYADTTTKGRA